MHILMDVESSWICFRMGQLAEVGFCRGKACFSQLVHAYGPAMRLPEDRLKTER